jgi:hypothetical protein
MTSLWLYLDSLPLTALALFASGYCFFLATVLACFKRRGIETCERCGGEWQYTDRGNGVHVCFPGRRVAP